MSFANPQTWTWSDAARLTGSVSSGTPGPLFPCLQNGTLQALSLGLYDALASTCLLEIRSEQWVATVGMTLVLL